MLCLIAAGRKTTVIAEQLRISAPSVVAFRASAIASFSALVMIKI
ncbi:MAG: hypothetical protein ACJ8CR_37990 [Roseiflexaceae bacterium]